VNPVRIWFTITSTPLSKLAPLSHVTLKPTGCAAAIDTDINKTIPMIIKKAKRFIILLPYAEKKLYSSLYNRSQISASQEMESAIVKKFKLKRVKNSILHENHLNIQ
jgi:hypothetical protein